MCATLQYILYIYYIMRGVFLQAFLHLLGAVFLNVILPEFAFVTPDYGQFLI